MKKPLKIAAAIGIMVPIALVSLLYFTHTKSIPISKEKIVQEFQGNYNVFMNIVRFAQATQGNLYVANDDRKLIIRGDQGHLSNGNQAAYHDLQFVMYSLKFVGIYENPDNVMFRKEGGGYDQGIIYVKTGKPLPKVLRHTELITDRWYYYWTTHE